MSKKASYENLVYRRMFACGFALEMEWGGWEGEGETRRERGRGGEGHQQY